MSSARFRYYGEFTEVIDKARAAGEAWYPSDDDRDAKSLRAAARLRQVRVRIIKRVRSGTFGYVIIVKPAGDLS